MNTRSDMGEMLLYERSSEGRNGSLLPDVGVPAQPLPDESLLRGEFRLPQVSQPEVVRYFTILSQRNFSIDTGFYPLGSCTMKYNPKINEMAANMDGFANIHPNQPDEQVQGALQLMYELQQMLGEITGLNHVSLAPLAGAHGEYAGLSIARSYHQRRGETDRTVALVPDSAHGTNPASAAMAGLTVKTVKSDAAGNVDLDSLRELADSRSAVFMLTLPSTLGLFEPNILEIAKIIHDAGALMYADGANLNALLGLARFADLGFDICHSNLHKTFSTPHGGGGPGSGPVMVNDKLADYLPAPVVTRDEQQQYHLTAPVATIGRIGGFHGSFGVLVRAYTYIRHLGKEWLPQVARDAIINANYLQSQLKPMYECASGDRYCMHETVLEATRQAKQGVTALDISKRLLDYGIHSPTMYFPIIVKEALMVEPTETESRETLDEFLNVMRAIQKEIDEDPELVRKAPHSFQVTRFDEAAAARNPRLRWSAIKDS